MHWMRRHARGRPPHPDVLTPAEWRVLEHLREGLTNAEIAERTGLARNTVKHHVSSMLAKTGLADREALARWQGTPAPASRLALARERSPLLAPLAWLRAHGRAAGIGAGVALGAAALVLLAAAMPRVLDGGDGDVAATPTPTAVVEAIATPTAIAVQADPVTLTQPVDVEGEFLVVVGRPGTDAPAGPIERVRFGAGGAVEREVVLNPGNLGLPNAYLTTWGNVAFPPVAAGDAVVVSVCHTQSCGGLDFAEPEARTTLLLSRDRGATWEELGTLEGPYWIASWTATGDEALLYEFPMTAQSEGRIVHWPSMAVLTPPGSVAPSYPALIPFFLPDGRIAWWDDSRRLIDETGAVLLDPRPLGLDVSIPSNPSLSPDGERMVVEWGQYLTLFERAPDGTYREVRTLEHGGTPYGWLSDDEVIIPSSVDPTAIGLPAGTRIEDIPLIVDFASAEIRPIQGFLDPDFATRLNKVIGYEPGP